MFPAIRAGLPQFSRNTELRYAEREIAASHPLDNTKKSGRGRINAVQVTLVAQKNVQSAELSTVMDRATLGHTKSYSNNVTKGCLNPASSQQRAIHILLHTFRSDFIQEARILTCLNHPNLVSVVGVCVSDGDPLYMICEYGDKGDLCQFLQDHVAETSLSKSSGAPTLR